MSEHVFHVGYQGSSTATLDVDDPDDWDGEALVRALQDDAGASRDARALITAWVAQVVHHDDCPCRSEPAPPA